jgi:hypothetical protein
VGCGWGGVASEAEPVSGDVAEVDRAGVDAVDVVDVDRPEEGEETVGGEVGWDGIDVTEGLS